jgi:hypothetical protein
MQCGIPFGLVFDKKNWSLTRLTHLMALVAFSVGLVACDNAIQSVAKSKPQPGAQIQLTPGSPSVLSGGKLQFSATVINSGNSGVDWSASAGAITSTGLFTAPTVAQAEFVAVTARTASANDEARVIVSILPPASCVKVQISPLDSSITPGAKIQFSASVTNVSNSAVAWSSSAGAITSGGLFTAPATTIVKTITVTATSAAQPSAQASATISLANAQLMIASASLPSGYVGSAYDVQLVATGGQPPYRWTISSGSLPTGFRLSSSSGTITGSAVQSGTFTLAIQVTDAALNTSLRNFTLVVSKPNVTCGPPTYGCSLSHLGIAQLPSAPPNVGNLVGANTIVVDPDFGNRITRVTDFNTNPAAVMAWSRTFVTASSGSADENIWNTDSTLFVVQDEGTFAYPYSFNPSTLQASRMYVASYPSTAGLQLSSSGTWSRVNSNTFYMYDGTAVLKYDFTDRTTPPSPQTVFDFTSSRNCLPAGFSATWQSKAGVSAHDDVFAAGYSDSGGQGTGIYAAVYKAGSGCSLLNTQTGQVTGDWGVKGTINKPDRWTIHNAKLSKDGNWLILMPQICKSPTCSPGPYFWQIGTTNVRSCGDAGQCGGHWTEGYNHWVNNDNSPFGNELMRAFSETTVTNLTTRIPIGITGPFDQHQSWNNVDPADSFPILTSTWSSVSPFPAPWYNEIIGVATDGSGKVWRFAHSFITARSQYFSTLYGIGSVSQDGRFFLFSSDWMGTLGSNTGSKNCTVGIDCRGDVFVVELR